MPPDVQLKREQCVHKVKYQPKDLEMLEQGVVDRLQFFRDPFIFARDQMTVFVKTLTETVAAIFEGDDGESGAEPSVEAIVVD